MAFLTFLHPRRRCLANLRIEDIDAYLIAASTRYTRSVVADVSGSVRDFLRFLYATGRLSSEMASLVVTPRLRKGERPLRSLPWTDVQRILQAVDRSTAGGQRDYAVLLLMSVYGLGTGEVTGLTLDDIDWQAATLRVIRPKTGAEIVLPLLPAVARTLVHYLRHGRPGHTPTRHLFVQRRLPHRRLSSASAIRHILIKHARFAGVEASYLGSHVLRHSHARQQTELGVAPQIIGDILGHRRPESTSAYIHIATERLRELALRVPQ
jgi:site-specific recombinase XerD